MLYVLTKVGSDEKKLNRYNLEVDGVPDPNWQGVQYDHANKFLLERMQPADQLVVKMSDEFRYEYTGESLVAEENRRRAHKGEPGLRCGA